MSGFQARMREGKLAAIAARNRGEGYGRCRSRIHVPVAVKYRDWGELETGLQALIDREFCVWWGLAKDLEWIVTDLRDPTIRSFNEIPF